ncbi:hypothetical protein [Rhizobium sp. BK176]|uniref:hypothetical protein n=1 Tax=Rhizobium sp. BK176 TaxID=2587071 RepID=UPI0021689F3D|nr:hypothetical protein [Rhizobium sp. BK176]MCS4088752.1 hypothetical protein [Rhizobium sp. BK176]
MGVGVSQETRGTVANDIYMKVLKDTYAEMQAARQLTPRHQEWFNGVVRGSTPQQGDSLENAVAKAVAARMKTVFLAFGDRKHAEFTDKMRFRHNMVKSVDAGLIPGYLSHGICRFGEVKEKTAKTYETIRFFVTNGDIELRTDQQRYVKLLDSSRDKIMYYGVAQTFDRCGNLLGFNKDRGEDGVMFLTDDKQEALFQIAALSTDMTADYFRSIAVPAQPKAQAAAAPRF